MSNHRFLTSLGQPYLAFTAESTGDSATLPAGGLIIAKADMRVDSLPVQHKVVAAGCTSNGTTTLTLPTTTGIAVGDTVLNGGSLGIVAGTTVVGPITGTTLVLSAAAGTGTGEATFFNPDELHPVFAFEHDIQTQVPIFEMGVTPSGRLKVLVKGGGTWQSISGLFSDGTAWNDVAVLYTRATGVVSVTINGLAVSGTMVGAVAGALIPVAGYQTRLMLFNGRDGLSRSVVSVRFLGLTFARTTGEQSFYTWRFPEGRGATITAENTSELPVSDLPGAAMVATFYDPFLTHPWGATPTGSTNSYYRWGLATDYTRLAKPVTTFTRVTA